MAFNTYDLGDLVKVSATFTDADTGLAADPTTVKLSVKDPAGIVTPYVYLTDAEIVRDGVGLYHANLDVDQSGKWYARWFSEGTGQAAEETRFQVRTVNAQ